MPKFDTPITANAESLEKVLANPLPQLLLLHNRHNHLATLEDAFKRLAKSEAGKLLLVKMDVADNPDHTPSEGTPLLIAHKDGNEVARRSNPTPIVLDDFAAYLLGKTKHLKNDPAPSTEKVISKPVHVSDATFKEVVLKSDKPVLVDFWAAWCAPCRMVAPTLEKIAGDLAGKLIVAKLDVDQNPAIAMEYGIQGIPALLIFKNGKLVDQTAGALPEPHLLRFVQPHL